MDKDGKIRKNNQKQGEIMKMQENQYKKQGKHRKTQQTEIQKNSPTVKKKTKQISRRTLPAWQHSYTATLSTTISQTPKKCWKSLELAMPCAGPARCGSRFLCSSRRKLFQATHGAHGGQASSNLIRNKPHWFFMLHVFPTAAMKGFRNFTL